MDGKQATCFVVTILLVLVTFSVSPIKGQIICPWCDKSTQSRLLDCVGTEMIGRPELMMIPLQHIDDIKWQVASYSDARGDMPYDAKKLDVDNKFVKEMANVVKKNNYGNNDAVINVISELAGNCYSLVTGYDPNVVSQEVKAMVKDDIRKSTEPLGENSNSEQNSRVPYSANQNQPGIQLSRPEIQQPSNNGPFNPPVSSPVISFDNPPFMNKGHFNSPGPSLVNSFGNPSTVNNAPFNSPRSPPVNSFDNPSYMNKSPLDPASPPGNPFVNDGAESSKNWSSNDYKGQAHARSDFSKNQAPSSSPPGPSLQNDNESQAYEHSSDSSALTSTASPEISTSQDSKSTDSVTLYNSNRTTPSPNADTSQKKTAGQEETDGQEQACDERFKIALYEKLINDDRFCNFFGKLPISTTKPEVPEIIKHAFKEYGIEQHYPEFLTLWRFDSKMLNKESSAKDWDEVISKILKIIFSRNNLLKGDCEEAGEKMACYILDSFPGDPATSCTENTNQNGGNYETSTESNSNSSDQKENTASDSTTNASTENNFDSEKSADSDNPSFPELHSKLANIFKQDGVTKQNGDNVPFSNLLSAFETQENLEKLHRAAESCISPSGFDFKKFLTTMEEVTDSIQRNHPDWSHDKCQKEMYSETVAVLTKELQDTLKDNNNNATRQSSSTQSDSAIYASDSQVSNSGTQPEVSNDSSWPSDDSKYSAPGTDFVSGIVPQRQQDYGGYADGTEPVNIPPPRNQPVSGDFNAGLTQPSNFAPAPVNTNYRDSSNGNLQNSQFPQSNTQNFPLDYSAGAPSNMEAQLYPETQPFPANQNTGFQQSQNFAPDYGVLNYPNGNFGNSQFQAYPSKDQGFNAGPSVVPNGNSQNFPPHLNQDSNYGVPATGANYNTQPQFNHNYRVPADGQVNPQW